MTLRHLGLASVALTAIMVILECGSAPLEPPPPVGEGEWVYNFLRDYEYVDGRIFDLGRAGEFTPGDSIVSLRLYQQTSLIGPEAVITRMVVNPAHPDSFLEESANLLASPIALEEYEVYGEYDATPYVVLDDRIAHNAALGVWMIVKRTGGVIDTIGSVGADTLLLKMICPTYPAPSQQTWDLMWRNCYYVGRHHTLYEDLEITVWRGLPGSENSNNVFYTQENPITGDNQTYIEILGLDQINTKGGRLPDGHVDERVEIWRPEWGLLIFPHRTPFDTDTIFTDSLGSVTQQLQSRVPELYNLMYCDPGRLENSKYFIRIGSLVR